MDNRYGNRIAIQVVVILHRNGHHLGEYKTRDVSSSGLFIETDSLDLHLGALVDLTFVLKNKRNERRQIKGMLIRYSFEGAGFMLESSFCGILPYLKHPDQDTLEMNPHDQYTCAEIHNMQSKYDDPLVSGNFIKKS